jgi:hypothetical protein
VGKPIRYGVGEGRCCVEKKRANAPTQPTGIGVQASRERLAEITSGRASDQQGLTTTCKDPRRDIELEAVGGRWSGA